MNSMLSILINLRVKAAIFIVCYFFTGTIQAQDCQIGYVDESISLPDTGLVGNLFKEMKNDSKNMFYVLLNIKYGQSNSNEIFYLVFDSANILKKEHFKNGINLDSKTTAKDFSRAGFKNIQTKGYFTGSCNSFGTHKIATLIVSNNYCNNFIALFSIDGEVEKTVKRNEKMKVLANAYELLKDVFSF